MKILFLAPISSIHVVRWIHLLPMDWDIHILNTNFAYQASEFKRPITIYSLFYVRKKETSHIRYFGIPLFFNPLGIVFTKMSDYPFYKVYRFLLERYLKSVISFLKPDFIHSFELMQSATPFTHCMPLQRSFKWIVSHFGSELYLFSRLPEHKKEFQELMPSIDFFSAECTRDNLIACSLGLNQEKCLPIIPTGGGYFLEKALALRQEILPLQRKYILMKGYQTFAGRALLALDALKLCQDELKGFTLVISSPSKDVILMARLFEQETGIPVCLLQKHQTHDEMLTWQSKSRVSLGVSVSDGISTALLEAIAMGAFPIQTGTACASEWITHGESGFIVSHWDPYDIAKCVKIALTDDMLVEKAYLKNEHTLKTKLEFEDLKNRALKYYIS